MGYTRSMEFALTINREYPVYAVTVSMGSAWYYLLDDDDQPWPTYSPSALFEITDGELPHSWRIGYFRHSVDIERQYPIISFPEWAEDRTFYERLVDGDSEAITVFERRKSEVLKEGTGNAR